MKALASERELIVVLLDPDAMTDSGPTSRRQSVRDGDSSRGEHDATFVLDRIFEGACRPFKVRVEQVLQSQPSLIVSFKLSNTLEFYGYTVSLKCFFFGFSKLKSVSVYIYFPSHLDSRTTGRRHCTVQYNMVS